MRERVGHAPEKRQDRAIDRIVRPSFGPAKDDERGFQQGGEAGASKPSGRPREDVAAEPAEREAATEINRSRSGC